MTTLPAHGSSNVPQAGTAPLAAAPSSVPNATVLDSTARVLRHHGLTTIFGNPGSNELPFLAGLGDGFNFVLGLHEQVVLGMAEGFARATGGPALVNLHAASGTGNAMGALTNAHYGGIPLVILAGQQVRATVGQESMLANVDANLLTKPLTKFAHEPLAPADVPRTISQAIFESMSHPPGPSYVSVPLDDWAQPALPSDALLLTRTVHGAGALPTSLADELTGALDCATHPAIVLGPQADAAGAHDREIWDAFIRLAEQVDATVYVAPSPSRGVFPTTHPNYGGVLVPGIRSVHDRLAAHDAVFVFGAPVFRYHRWEPGAYLAEGTVLWQITQSPSEAARAPFGRAIVGDVGDAAKLLSSRVSDRGVRRPSRSLPPPRTSELGLTGTEFLDVLNAHVHDAVVYVNETTTLDLDYLERIDISGPGRYHFPASGGLGFGLPAAVGFAIGRPDATVVTTVGDGSANYGITALYTAAQRRTRTVFVIVNNSGYGALAGFAERMGVPDVPGIELGGIDFVKIAEGYGVPATSVSSREAFEAAYRNALTAAGPILIEARVVRD